ncbi:MAG: rhamnogalacturonan acetylesterase [Paludibacter sp.]
MNPSLNQAQTKEKAGHALQKKIFVAVLGMLILVCSNTNKPVTVFMIGDSTMANKVEKAFPENGWGMALGELLQSNALVHNVAQNGRSSKSFIAEGRWDSVRNKLAKGDFVIIQFGHNDSKPDSTRRTDPQTTYKENLRRFITETRAKGGNPILCTSIVRRSFGKDGKLTDTHGGYPQAMREVAHELNVPLVDLQKLTEEAVNKRGEEAFEKVVYGFESR